MESEAITSTEIRTLAREIGKDHELDNDLWAVNNTNHRLLAVLLGVLESKMQKSDPLIQETMNWCPAEIGILDEALRDRWIRLGERLGLYKDYPVSRGCISPYLPEWIGAMAGSSN